MLVVMLMVCGTFAGAGCRAFSNAGGSLLIESLNNGSTLSPEVRTAVYKRVDANTADLYFSDLPEERLTDPLDKLEGVSGCILHIHYFLNPDAGSTPIDDTACNVTLRNFVIAPGAGDGQPMVMGVYGGGGFFFPSGSPGSTIFGGSMRDGTHRLVGATPGFNDALGPAAIGGKMLATRDDDAAEAVERKLRGLMRRLAEVKPADPK